MISEKDYVTYSGSVGADLKKPGRLGSALVVFVGKVSEYALGRSFFCCPDVGLVMLLFATTAY